MTGEREKDYGLCKGTGYKVEGTYTFFFLVINQDSKVDLKGIETRVSID